MYPLYMFLNHHFKHFLIFFYKIHFLNIIIKILFYIYFIFCWFFSIRWTPRSITSTSQKWKKRYKHCVHSLSIEWLFRIIPNLMKSWWDILIKITLFDLIVLLCFFSHKKIIQGPFPNYYDWEVKTKGKEHSSS